MRKLSIVSLVVLLPVFGCGGGTSPSPTQPTTQTPAPTPTNHSPIINSLNVAPAFGISELTTFSFNASAADPDGDPVSYAWDAAGFATAGTNGTTTPKGDGPAVFKVTVSDGKGGSVTDTRTVTIGNATGRWSGTWDIWVFTSSLTQTGGLITGDYADQLGAGRLDPAVSNTIDANGSIKLRYKQAIFSDFTFTGMMDATGKRITGVVNGSGYVNMPFTMTKQ